MIGRPIKLIAFDLDGTLTESKQPINNKTARFLASLANDYEIAIVTGGTMEQIKTQVLDRLPNWVQDKMHLMPCSGAEYFRFGDTLYRNFISKQERAVMVPMVTGLLKQMGYWIENPAGDIIEDRGSQITISALGQKANSKDKEDWDPYGNKRREIRDAIKTMFPDYSVRVGGLTSVDISMYGIDKEYAIKELLEWNQFEPSDVLYIGDKFRPGENDYPALLAGVTCLRVTSYTDTPRIVGKYLG
jgi:HAD superfamily hydrolase (TIGR01484 family)